MPESERERREAEIAGKWAKASPRLDERARRIWLGAEADELGYGGIKFVAQATGAAIETVRSGIADLGKDPQEQQEQDGPRRVRQPGGGRKKAEDRDPGLPAALDDLLDDDKSEAGDPMTPRLRWTSKSLVKLSDELTAQGHEASPTMVRRLMYQAGWRLQSNNKSMAKASRTRTGTPSSATSASRPRSSRRPGSRWSAWTPRRRSSSGTSPTAAGMGTRRGGAPASWTTTSRVGRGEGHSLRRI